ncbi:FAD-dependent oxidoreductase [Chloroflexota bacterium]
MDKINITNMKEMKADLVIIGTGGGGMAAAVAAAENGVKNILVLEKLKSIGGNTAMSAGLFGIDSPVQKRAAQELNKEEFFRIAMEWAHWRINPRIVRALIEKSGDTIGWLEKKGLEFVLSPLMPNQAVETWHTNPLRGAGMIKALAEDCRKMGVKVFTSMPAKRLLVGSDGSVEGVIAEKWGNEIKIQSECVIIASGGYGGNKELLQQYCSYYRENMNCDGLHHTGDGLKMAMQIGAATEGLGHLLMSGPQVSGIMRLNVGDDPQNTWPVLLMALTLEPSVWVNKRGERFIDEGTGFNHFASSNGVNQQPDNICYTIFDQSIIDTMTEEGMIIGLGHTRVQQRASLPGLERELKLQDKGIISIEQVNKETCNGCNICSSMCPVGIVELDTDTDSIEHSPCRFACPAGVDMRTYFWLLRTGNIHEAVRKMREYLPLPAITGRVCPHLCESECARRDVDEAVNINSIERFLADFSMLEKAEPVPKQYSKKVAVVGSGPAGLSAAYFLVRSGYPVTVFEQEKRLGGMLRMGIPEYRLPREVLDAQINYIADLGVEFQTGITIGRDIKMEQIRKDYPAVFFAPGNQLSRKIELEGSQQKGVLWGLDFLKDVNLNGNARVGDRVVVIGGGNVAVDVALTALRLGAREVEIACLETGEEMPAYKEEIEQAISEGVKINEGWGPNKVLGDGTKITGIELIKCTGVLNGNGEFNPAYDKNTTKTLNADTVILAVGQAPDLSQVPEGVETEGDAVKADALTLESAVAGVFAGGDIVKPAGSVVQAITDGRRAAESIDRYLRGEDLRKGRDTEPQKVQQPPKEGIPQESRNKTPVSAVSHVSGNFSEVKPGYDEETVFLEVNRCMTCGSKASIKIESDCVMCRACELNCPQHAVSPQAVKHVEPVVKIANNWNELASWIGCNPDVLKATIHEYNECCDHGRDPIFGKRNELLIPLRTPPFYVIKGNSDFLDTIGGIKINERMEVLNQEDMPIPGLFAAGVATGGWETESYCAPLSGEASGFAVNSGRIAGENAAKLITQSSC